PGKSSDEWQRKLSRAPISAQVKGLTRRRTSVCNDEAAEARVRWATSGVVGSSAGKAISLRTFSCLARVPEDKDSRSATWQKSGDGSHDANRRRGALALDVARGRTRLALRLPAVPGLRPSDVADDVRGGGRGLLSRPREPPTHSIQYDPVQLVRGG